MPSGKISLYIEDKLVFTKDFLNRLERVKITNYWNRICTKQNKYFYWQVRLTEIEQPETIEYFNLKNEQQCVKQF
jgi:hypothetical protein